MTQKQRSFFGFLKENPSFLAPGAILVFLSIYEFTHPPVPWASLIISLGAVSYALVISMIFVLSTFQSYYVEKACWRCEKREAAIVVKRNRKSLDKYLAKIVRKNHHAHTLQWKVKELEDDPFPEEWHKIEY